MDNPYQWHVYDWVEKIDSEADGKYLLAHSLVYEHGKGWMEFHSGILPLSAHIPANIPRVPPEVTFAKGEQTID